MRIEVDRLPPREYSPNYHGSWTSRYAAGVKYKDFVFYEAVNVRNTGNYQQFRKARLDLTFIFDRERIRDEDNLRARFKPGQDALVTAGLIEDDSWKHLVMGDINIIVDKERAPMTIIELQEVK